MTSSFSSPGFGGALAVALSLVTSVVLILTSVNSFLTSRDPRNGRPKAPYTSNAGVQAAS